MEVTHVPQNKLQFVVDALPVSTTHQPILAGTDITDKQALQSESPLRLRNGTSQPVRFTPSPVPRPEWTSTSLVIAGAQAAELPSVPVLFNEPTENARFSRRIDPIYPESARLAHKQGLVVLEATIGVDGVARNIEVVKVVEVRGLGCEEAAIAALKASSSCQRNRAKFLSGNASVSRIVSNSNPSNSVSLLLHCTSVLFCCAETKRLALSRHSAYNFPH